MHKQALLPLGTVGEGLADNLSSLVDMFSKLNSANKSNPTSNFDSYGY